MKPILSFLINTLIITTPSINLNYYNQTHFNYKWQSVSSALLSTTELIITSGPYTENILIKTLSLNMTQLKVLTFTKYHSDKSTPIIVPKTISSSQCLTYNLVRIIFRSNYLRELTELNLINTNIDDRHFLIDTNKLLSK